MNSIRYPKNRQGVSPIKCKPCWKVLTKIEEKTTIDEIKKKTGFTEANLYVYLGLLKKIGLILVENDPDKPRKKLYSLSGYFTQIGIYKELSENGETEFPPIPQKPSKMNDHVKKFYFAVKDDNNIQDLDFFWRTYMLNAKISDVF